MTLSEARGHDQLAKQIAERHPALYAQRAEDVRRVGSAWGCLGAWWSPWMFCLAEV
jgi:hypothetical protein